MTFLVLIYYFASEQHYLWIMCCLNFVSIEAVERTSEPSEEGLGISRLVLYFNHTLADVSKLKKSISVLYKHHEYSKTLTKGFLYLWRVCLYLSFIMRTGFLLGRLLSRSARLGNISFYITIIMFLEYLVNFIIFTKTE